MKVITLNDIEFQESCRQLFSLINRDFDLVVGIMKGGDFVLKTYQSYAPKKGQSYGVVDLQRTTTGFKKKRILKYLLRNLPYSILDKIRVYEFHWLNRKLKNQIIEPVEDFDMALDRPEEVKHILVLDDAIDSGATMLSTVKGLSKKYPRARIVTAVVAWTNSNSIYQPDYYRFKGVLIRFPWSLDYKKWSV